MKSWAVGIIHGLSECDDATMSENGARLQEACIHQIKHNGQMWLLPAPQRMSPPLRMKGRVL